MGLAIHGDLALGHRLQQRALGLGCGAVDLVRQQQAGKDRAGMKTELARLALVYADPDNVRWEQVAGELHTLEIQREAGGQRMGQGGLAHAGHVFQQQVAAGDQAGEGELHLARLAQQHAIDLGHGGLQVRAQRFIVQRSDGGHDFLAAGKGDAGQGACVTKAV